MIHDPGYTAPSPITGWTVTDADNLDKTTKAQGVITALLALVALLLVAGLVLGIVGYNKTAERLDNIETSTAHTAAEVAP